MDEVQDQKVKANDLHQEIHALEGRDLQLWSIGVLICLVVAAGFVAIIWPNLMWNLGVVRMSGRYLPQLLFGFIALIVLFNIYVLQQRQTLLRRRDELVRQVLRSEAAERLSMMDPLTETFNRRFLEYVLPREIGRTDRSGTTLSFVMCDVDGFKSVNTRFGHLAGDKILIDVAGLLKRTFRASDTVIRYGGDEFLILMDATDEPGAQPALDRLQSLVQAWNRANPMDGYKLGISCGVAAYTKGANIQEVLDSADDRMYRSKLRLATAQAG